MHGLPHRLDPGLKAAGLQLRLAALRGLETAVAAQRHAVGGRPAVDHHQVVEAGGGDAPGHRLRSGAVIGVGLNVRMPAQQAASIDQPWLDLAQALPQPVTRTAVAAAVLARLLPALEAFDAEGLAPFRPRYAALDALYGREVVVHLDGGQVLGTAEGIAEDGALRLRTPQGLRDFHAGEVSVRVDGR